MTFNNRSQITTKQLFTLKIFSYRLFLQAQINP